MSGYHEPMGIIHDSESNDDLLKAVACNNVTLAQKLVHSDMNIFAVSGPWERSAMMQAISSENLTMIDILIEGGETANRVYGSSGATAYHYAIMDEKWASLAHLLRRQSYPVTGCDGYSPLNLAKNIGFWRGVSILEQERDSPGFWNYKENVVFGDVHKRLGRNRQPKGTSEEMMMMNSNWVIDCLEYESFAPSEDYLEGIGWFTRTISEKKFCVYCCVAHFQIIKMRQMNDNKSVNMACDM